MQISTLEKNTTSLVLPAWQKNFMVDINTLLPEGQVFNIETIPILARVKWVNEKYEKDHKINFFSHLPNVSVDDVKIWLKLHGINYHTVRNDKPYIEGYQFRYMDDRSIACMTLPGGGKSTIAVDKNGKLVHVFDIDGCLCDDISNDYPELMVTAKPMPGVIEMVNRLYDAGHHVVFFTARLESEHGAITRQWFKDHNVKHYDILFGKAKGGNYVYVSNIRGESFQFLGILPKWN